MKHAFAVCAATAFSLIGGLTVYAPTTLSYKAEEPPPVATSTLVQATTTPYNCECVVWLRQSKGIDIKGNARDIQPNSSLTVGGVILIDYEKASHAGRVLSLEGEELVYESSNFDSKNPCKITQTRINVHDVRIRGYYSPDSSYGSVRFLAMGGRGTTTMAQN